MGRICPNCGFVESEENEFFETPEHNPAVLVRKDATERAPVLGCPECGTVFFDPKNPNICQSLTEKKKEREEYFASRDREGLQFLGIMSLAVGIMVTLLLVFSK